jgi:aspartyl-tRNA(Asn)/glutamyl-tRNA(Gln) amidotransferase subunit A
VRSDHSASRDPAGLVSPAGADGDGGLTALADALRAGVVSAVGVTRAALERIQRLNPALRAFARVDAERALGDAATLDAERSVGRVRGPLHGVPIAFKDLCVVRGQPVRCGIGDAGYFTDAGDATVARRLRDAGAVSLGTLAMTPLAMGTFGVNEIEGTPVNPWNADRVPGGSSSGCGVALAARLVAGAVGTDTGGSIRLPAAACGVVGLKPTFGRVSRAGVMPLSSSLDHVGPMARRVRDVALLLAAMSGRDARDPSSAGRRPPPGAVPPGVRGLRVGLPGDAYFSDVDAAVRAAVGDAARVLADLGATVDTVKVPDPRPLVQASAIVVRAEAAARHGRLLEAPEATRLPAFVRARLRTGLAVSAADYLRAVDACAEHRTRFVREAFATADALLLPATPEIPPPLDAVSGAPADLDARMASFARFARLFNALGIPVLALPGGFTDAGIPLGLQIAGRPFDEVTVLRLGAAYEDAAGWYRRRPPLAGGPA